MTLNGNTSYSTLSLVVEDGKKPERSTSRKLALSAVVFVACIGMFFAGRLNSQPADYTYEEVVNAASFCGAGTFIGGCEPCKECETYEYANGGCNWFKDTFCSYCEPIANCKRDKLSCSSRNDQTCEVCDCDDPIDSWDDVVKEEARDNDSTFSCYIGDNCDPCKPCAKGFFETEACNPETNSPTQCKECATCGEDTFVSEVCTYQSDTKCAACDTCDAKGSGQTSEKTCTGRENTGSDDFNDIFTKGENTKCKTCTPCDPAAMLFVEGVCTSTTDTVCGGCSSCEEGDFIGTKCKTSKYPTDPGRDTQCTACSALKDTGYFLKTDCDPTGDSDYEYTMCRQCQYGEYEQDDCILGTKDSLGSDRVCAGCSEIPNCKGMNVCSTGQDATCSRCSQPGAHVTDSKDVDFFGSWETCCDERSLGSKCEFVYHDQKCDQDEVSYMERTAFKGGFFEEPTRGTTAADFVLWCQKLCGEHKECTAFEVPKGIADETELPAKSTICSLKNHDNYDFKWAGDGPKHTCWTKRVEEKDCCKTCTDGKACGDSCIAKGNVCNTVVGCACDA